MSKVWHWAAVVVAAIPGAARADAARSSLYTLPADVALKVSGGPANSDGSGIKGDTSVDLHSRIGDTTLSGASTSAPPNSSLPTDRIDRKVGLDSNLHGPAGIKITVQASSEVHDVRQARTLVPAGLTSTSATTRTDSIDATATAQPLSGVGITVRVSQQNDVATQDNVVTAGAVRNNAVATTDRKTSASADWSPLSFLQLKAGATSEAMSVTTHGAVNAGDEYRYTEPRVSATAKLWDGAQMKVSGEDAVSPVNPYDFAALAQAAGPDTDLRIAPNREWRNEAGIAQTFDNGGTLSATVTRARVESTTELGLTPDGATTPLSISGGERRQIEARLTLPLSDLGLPDTTISSQTTMRQSQVRDPVTGEVRRISGEIPREASMKLTHKDDSHHLEWGVSGRLTTNRTFYQPAQISASRTNSGVGAFVTYRPGRYIVSLNADGLIGGTRSQTDTIYSGTRAGSVTATNRTGDSNPMVSVSVSQKF